MYYLASSPNYVPTLTIEFQYQSSLLNFPCRSNVSVRVARFKDMDNVSTCRSRSCIPRETYACVRACVRACVHECVHARDDGRRRMELSRISNPTPPVGALPRQGGGSGEHLSAWISLREFISSIRARRIRNHDGNVICTPSFAAEMPKVCTERVQISALHQNNHQIFLNL